MKKQIIEATRDYCTKNKLSQDAIGELASVNESYINALLRGNFFIKGRDGKSVEIKDAYFRKLARAVGYAYEPVYCELIETMQYIQIYTELADAKNSGRTKMIVGETGCGKTYTVRRFKKDFPVDTYVVTVSNLHNMEGVINELCDMLGVTATGNLLPRLKKAAARLQHIKMEGGKPILILDESENLRLPALKMLKSLYDGVKDYCAIAMVGTAQLPDKLEILRDRNVEGIPQFCRRFKAGRRDVVDIRREMFEPFLTQVEDANVRTLIVSLSSNYGELTDYLEPFLREADRNGIEPNEENFRYLFGLIRK